MKKLTTLSVMLLVSTGLYASDTHDEQTTIEQEQQVEQQEEANTEQQEQEEAQEVKSESVDQADQEVDDFDAIATEMEDAGYEPQVRTPYRVEMWMRRVGNFLVGSYYSAKAATKRMVAKFSFKRNKGIKRAKVQA